MDALWIILTACMAALSCSLLGNYLVLRKISMIGDAISHAVLPGIVLGFLLVGSTTSPLLLIGAALVGLGTTWIISFFQRMGGIQSDAAIGITFTFFFALGVLLISIFTKKVDLDPACILYGDLLYVPFDTLVFRNISLGPRAFYGLSGVFLLNLAFVKCAYKELLLTSFDDTYAQSIGMKPARWLYLLMMMTAITTVVAFEAVGVTLVVALLVVPSATAYLLTENMKNMIFLSALFGVLATILGYFLAVYLNGAVAGAIVTVLGGIFVIAWVFTVFYTPSTKEF